MCNFKVNLQIRHRRSRRDVSDRQMFHSESPGGVTPAGQTLPAGCTWVLSGTVGFGTDKTRARSSYQTQESEDWQACLAGGERLDSNGPLLAGEAHPSRRDREQASDVG